MLGCEEAADTRSIHLGKGKQPVIIYEGQRIVEGRNVN